MRYRVVHHTEYRYVQPVALCHNETHLRPRAVAHQRCLSHALVIDPEPDLISEREDFFGNPTASFSMQRGHSHLSVTARSEVEVGSPRRPGQAPDSIQRILAGEPTQAPRITPGRPGPPWQEYFDPREVDVG